MSMTQCLNVVKREGEGLTQLILADGARVPLVDAVKVAEVSPCSIFSCSLFHAFLPLCFGSVGTSRPPRVCLHLARTQHGVIVCVCAGCPRIELIGCCRIFSWANSGQSGL